MTISKSYLEKGKCVSHPIVGIDLLQRPEHKILPPETSRDLNERMQGNKG